MPRKPETIENFNERIKHLGIKVIDYKGIDHPCVYTCSHGLNTARGWELSKAKFCCRKAYYESGAMWKSKTRTLEHLREKALKDRNNIDVSETFIDTSGRYKKLANIKCNIHNIFYSSLTGKKIGICPQCNYERNIDQLKTAAPVAWKTVRDGVFVSKGETEWLNKLGVKERQVWLEDVKYKVDGYDKDTNTVYLYHGKFWHGCPKKYDSKMIHPLRNITMGQLYVMTLDYEARIKAAGYNLVVKWED